MTGAVFHPGHSELHGVTVVLETTGESTFIGRYHEETPAGVLLHDASEHRDQAGAPSRAEFVVRSRKFGVRADHRHIVVPLGQVRRIVRLMDWNEAGGET